MIEWVGKVNYLVHMEDHKKEHKKKRHVFHINMLQKWYSPVSAFLAQSVHDEEDIPDWNDTEGGQANKGTQLDSRQAHELDMLLGNFESLFTALPAHTTIAEHCIPTRDARPVRLPPYRLPHAFRDQVKEELDDMLVHGFIEHSKSNWYFPLVPVKKKDTSLSSSLELVSLSLC